MNNLWLFIDLDGCLCCDQWRCEYLPKDLPIGNQHYHEYHKRHYGDLIYKPVQELLLGSSVPVSQRVVATCRPALFKETTIEWLRQFDIGYRYLDMRDNGDHRYCAEVKQSMLDNWEDKYFYSTPQLEPRPIPLLIDNDKRNIEMWQSYGDPTIHMGENVHSLDSFIGTNCPVGIEGTMGEPGIGGDPRL